jgi:hypothetical protein
MNSRFTLSFVDKEIEKDFRVHRNKEITIFSILLLASRFIFALVLIYDIVKGEVNIKRLYMELVGQSWHLIALILGARYPKYLQRFHAP